MVAAGAIAEAVWLDEDMDASALWLAGAQKTTRIVTDGSPALPTKAGEVGVVPEYALQPALKAGGSDSPFCPAPTTPPCCATPGFRCPRRPPTRSAPPRWTGCAAS